MVSFASRELVSKGFMSLICVCGVGLSGLISCKDAGSEPPVVSLSTLALSVQDVSCTEAWLKISTSAGPCSVAVRRDGQKIQDLYLTTRDSVIVDEGLLPKQTYVYQEFKVRGGSVIETTQQVQATTLDTTSHNFTWQIDTLGDGASSVLYDVAIVNDTLVYAVGDLYLRDSSGQIDPIRYNATIWNGRRWTIIRIPYSTPDPFYGEIRWIFALSEKDIWFENSVHWDGQQFHNVDIGTSIFVGIGSNRMWGGPTGHLYVVGNSGTLAYSGDRGTTWGQLSSGTPLPIQDIWGSTDPSSGEPEILAVSSNKLVNQGVKLLRIQGTTVSPVSNAGLPWSLSGTWFVSHRRYYVVGDGLFRKMQLDSDSSWLAFHEGLTTYYTNAIRGRGTDIVICGAYGVLLTFNGMTWRNHQSETFLAGGSFYRVDIRGNLVVAVGHVGARAVALVGRRP